MPCLQQHHLKVGVDQTLAQPLRQWAGLKTDADDGQSQIGKMLQQQLRLTFDSRTILPDESTTQTLPSFTSIPA
ncbi:hypothetical protein X753_31680 [Mesorhizobium sp. LNJC399B00]|nr:hypothetical protein X753_31680 [Mesorhizobium sp. LNJC399B00]